jgi:hypothetical protein
VVRFYFDIHDSAQVMRDDEGTELASSDAAVHAAARSAVEIGQSRVTRGETGSVVIEVRDDQNQQVCTVTASTRIDRNDSPPQRSHPGCG